MSDMSRLEIKVRLAAEDIASHLAVHQADIENELREGVVQALAQAEVVRMAREAAEQCMKTAIENAVRNYFLYNGEGSKAISAIIEESAAKALQAIGKRV